MTDYERDQKWVRDACNGALVIDNGRYVIAPEQLRRFAAFAAGSRSGEDTRDAARWRHVCKTRPVLLLTGYFGNGCVNKSIADVEAEIDAAMGGNDA